jgi:PKHD-type hydroxylase
MRSDAFVQLAWPETMSVVVARYAVGDAYGFHVDNAVHADFRRRDLALSIGLDDGYEGGTMQFRHGSITTEVRLRAGHAVMFPPQIEHRVLPVTAGERLVALVWVTSRVRDHLEREILYRLHDAEEALVGDFDKERLVDALSFVRQNLLQRWLR